MIHTTHDREGAQSRAAEPGIHAAGARRPPAGEPRHRGKVGDRRAGRLGAGRPPPPATAAGAASPRPQDGSKNRTASEDTMIAAIYARKSTEENGVADEDKSVTRQVEHARAYAARKGWLVADDHIYVDGCVR